MKRAVIPYDFNAFGQAIKAARMAKGESRKNVSVSPRYLANIENKGQQPSLQIFYELVTRYHISVDQFFFPNETADKTTRRRFLLLRLPRPVLRRCPRPGSLPLREVLHRLHLHQWFLPAARHPLWISFPLL